MGATARDSCRERFDAFVGLEYENSILEIVSLNPTAESWKQGDREVVCALYDINNEKLVGSTEGSGI
jgi:hypothetical protein